MRDSIKTQIDERDKPKNEKIKDFVSDTLKIIDKKAGSQKITNFFSYKVFYCVEVRDIPGIVGQVKKAFENFQEGVITSNSVIVEAVFRVGEYYGTKHAVKKIGFMVVKKCTPGLGIALTAVDSYLLIEKPFKELVIGPVLKIIESELKPIIIQTIDANRAKINLSFVQSVDKDGNFEVLKKVESRPATQSLPSATPDPILQQMLESAFRSHVDPSSYFPHFSDTQKTSGPTFSEPNHAPYIQYDNGIKAGDWVDRPLNNIHQDYWAEQSAASKTQKCSVFATPDSIGCKYQSNAVEVTAAAGFGSIGVGVTLTTPAGIAVGAVAAVTAGVTAIVQDKRHYKLTPITALKPASSADEAAWKSYSKKVYEYFKRPTRSFFFRADNLAKLRSEHEKFMKVHLTDPDAIFFRNAIGHFIQNPDLSLLNTERPDFEKICARYQAVLDREHLKEMITQQQADIKEKAFSTACENFNTAAQNRDPDGMEQWINKLPAELQSQAQAAKQACVDQLTYEAAFKDAFNALEKNEFSSAMQHAEKYPELQNQLKQKYAENCSKLVKACCERGEYAKAEKVTKAFFEKTNSRLENEERHIAACRTAIQIEGLEISSFLLSRILEKMEAPAWVHAIKTGGVAAAHHYLSEQLKSLADYEPHGFENWQAGLSAIGTLANFASMFLEEEDKKYAKNIIYGTHAAGALLGTGLAIADAAGKLRPAAETTAAATDAITKLQPAAAASTSTGALHYASAGAKALSIAAPLASFANSWYFNEWRKEGKAPTTIEGVIAEDFCYYASHASSAVVIAQTQTFKIAMLHLAEFTQSHTSAVIAEKAVTAAKGITVFGEQALLLAAAHPFIAGAAIGGVCIAGIWYYCENRPYNNHLYNIQTCLKLAETGNTRKYLSEAAILNSEALKIYPNDPKLLERLEIIRGMEKDFEMLDNIDSYLKLAAQSETKKNLSMAMAIANEAIKYSPNDQQLLARLQKIQWLEKEIAEKFQEIKIAREKKFIEIYNSFTTSSDYENKGPLSDMKKNIENMTLDFKEIKAYCSEEVLLELRSKIASSRFDEIEKEALDKNIRAYASQRTEKLNFWFKNEEAIKNNISTLKKYIANIIANDQNNIEKSGQHFDEKEKQELIAQREIFIGKINSEIISFEEKLNNLTIHKEELEILTVECESLLKLLQARHIKSMQILYIKTVISFAVPIIPVILRGHFNIKKAERAQQDAPLNVSIYNKRIEQASLAPLATQLSFFTSSEADSLSTSSQPWSAYHA